MALAALEHGLRRARRGLAGLLAVYAGAVGLGVAVLSVLLYALGAWTRPRK